MSKPGGREDKGHQKIDVAVVGGGVAGVYATWRLATSRGGDGVHLFESTNRLGGRLKTLDLFPMLKFPLELGAMRYKRGHFLLDGLIEYLRLESAELDTSDCNYFLRGCRLPTAAHLGSGANKKGFSGPYKLSEKENSFAANLIKLAIVEALGSLEFSLPKREARKMKESIKDHIERDDLENLDWQTIVNEGSIQYKPYGKITNIHFYDVGFWNLLQHFLSNEAVLLIHDSLGYESIVSNWNAAAAVPWFVADFAKQQEWRVPCEGFENLINQLVDRLPSEGNSISLDHHLERVIPTKDGAYNWQLEFRSDGSKKTFLAKEVILALPRRALENLQVEDTEWSEIKRYYVSAVAPHKLFKFLLVYEEPWWTELTFPGTDFGRVTTDLPIRQVYYYGPEWIEKHAPQRLRKRSKKSWAVVMASYSDSHYVKFWSTFSSQNLLSAEALSDRHFCKPTGWKAMRPAEKKQLLQLKDQHGARWRMIMKIQSLLAELHSVELEKIPQPIVGFFMDWGEDPYQGGWHTWEVHRRASQVSEKMLQPIPDKGLYICGEAYSSEQGWIEGALKSTERVLVEKLSLSTPESWSASVDFDSYIKS